MLFSKVVAVQDGQKDLFWSGTTALLSGQGADESTTITDSSALASNWTANNNAKISTAQYKWGSSSISCDGTSGTNITATAASSNFVFGTGDFTIEGWFYPTSPWSTVSGFFDFRPTAGSNGAWPSLYFWTSTNKVYYDHSLGNRILTGVNPLSTDAWSHVAVARSGTSTKLFINGTQVGSTYTDSTDYVGGTNRPIVAGGTDTVWNGYCQDIRITKGMCRYKANFTVPSRAFAARG